MYAELLKSIYSATHDNPRLNEYFSIIKGIYDDTGQFSKYDQTSLITELREYLDDALEDYSKTEDEPLFLHRWQELRMNNFSPELYNQYTEIDTLAESALRDFVTFKLETIK
jgi:hypothetical protein